MSTSTAEISELQTAIETRDAAGVLAWYDDDAVINLIDRDHPPAHPTVLTGAAKISAYYTDICGRNIDHRVEHLVHTSTGLAYVEQCRYPDGTQVTCAAVAQLTGRRITRQTIVQAWDT